MIFAANEKKKSVFIQSRTAEQTRVSVCVSVCGSIRPSAGFNIERTTITEGRRGITAINITMINITIATIISKARPGRPAGSPWRPRLQRQGLPLPAAMLWSIYEKHRPPPSYEVIPWVDGRALGGHLNLTPVQELAGTRCPFSSKHRTTMDSNEFVFYSG